MAFEICEFLVNSFTDKTPEWISATAAAISTVGVWFVWKQLSLAKRIAQLQFEDTLEKEYRDLVARIPTKALLGSGLSPGEYEDSFDEFFRYFDLSNKQAALWKEKRIGKVTWDNWRSGIRFNLSLPAFSKAWGEVKSRTAGHAGEFFSELRGLEDSGFSGAWPKLSP